MSLLDNPSLSTTLLGYSICDEGVHERFERSHSSIEWTILCRWTDRAGLMFKLLGGAGLVDGIITLAGIFFHPLYPWMGATAVSIDGQPGAHGLTVGAGGIIAYDYARLKVEFSALGGGESTEYGEERIDYSGKIITVPPGTFGYGSGSARVNLTSAESPGLLIPRATLQRTILRQPSIPVSTIFSLLGHVNGGTFLGGAAGTVLFTGCCSERTFDTTGNKLWSVTYNMTFDALGWNKYLIPGTGTNGASFQLINDANGNSPYPSGDLSLLGFST